MLERSEDVTLALQALCEPAVPAHTWQFERDPTLQVAIATLRKPNTAHAALGDAPDELVPANHVALDRAIVGRRLGTDETGRLQEGRRGKCRVLGQQAAKFVRQRGVDGVKSRKSSLARRVVGVEQLTKQRVNLRPARGKPVEVEGTAGSRGLGRRHDFSAAASSRRAFCQSRRTVRSVIPRVSPMSASLMPPK